MPDLPRQNAQTQEGLRHRRPESATQTPVPHTLSGVRSSCSDDAMICERCGKAEMYRMHAVWRCPACGFKTDCCGW